eukprot:scaffold4783_cov373-Prasinococcus_capsulatus_cf.AAC.3
MAAASLCSRPFFGSGLSHLRRAVGPLGWAKCRRGAPMRRLLHGTKSAPRCPLPSPTASRRGRRSVVAAWRTAHRRGVTSHGARRRSTRRWHRIGGGAGIGR